MLRIAIVDDIADHAHALGAMTERVLAGTACQISLFTDEEAFFAEQQSRAHCDIVFLDIALAHTDGVSVAQKINRCAPGMQIIFVSAYLNYVTQIYNARHMYFLAKPVQEAQLRKALRQAVSAVEAQRDAQIMLTLSGGGMHVFLYSEIVCCERVGRTTVVHTRTKQEFRTPLRIKERLERLPRDRFISPHASFLIALDCVRSFTGDSVELTGGMTAPVSAHRKVEFREALERYML